jgi:hypothetical protein
MIFQPELVEQIKQSKKTTTRRPVKYANDGSIVDCRYKPMHAYRVQPGRGMHGVEQITVTDVKLGRLGDMTYQDARREGFRTRAGIGDLPAFVAYWTMLYGSHNPDQEVWVISFALGDLSDTDRWLASGSPPQTCAATLPNGKRCKRAFSGPDEKVCKCGARRPPERLDDRGYTTVASRGLKGEKPAIPEALQTQYVKDAHKRESVRTVEPIHGRIARLRSETSGMEREITELRSQMREGGVSGRDLERQIDRAQKALARANEILTAAA